MSLLLALVLVAAAPAGASPPAQFAKAHPGSAQVTSPSGRQLLQASGFLTAPSARGPEQAGRDLLASQGAAFGITPEQTLVLRHAPPAGAVGPVRFSRLVNGLPVFNGDLVVGVDAQARAFLVNAAEVGSELSGQHTLGEGAAAEAALASFGPAARASSTATIEKGYRTVGSLLRAVYQVDFIGAQPAGDWRVFIDGETSATRFRLNRRDYASAPGTVYEVSPVETSTTVCPLAGSGGHSFCAATAVKTLPNLTSGSSLEGSQTAVYNCNGGNAPTSSGSIPGACAQVNAVSSAFNFSPDLNFTSATDNFSAAMAYYHLDKHVSFMKALDPALPSGAGRAVRASLPAMVNVEDSGAPFENAYFSGGLDAMVFGQGAAGDYAYDASVMYHEFTHGAVSAWGGFHIDVDSRGGVDEPGAVNEGTADAMAAAELGRSQIGSFLSSTESPAAPYLRDLNDTNASRTCQGSGKVISRFGTTSVNGLDGEVHDDGEIWNGFFWEVYAGLRAASIKGCSGNCEAGAAIQYKALQLGVGSPTLGSYWQTFKSAASALFPSTPAVATYVECVAKRRGFDKCDRTVPLYASERQVQYVRLRWSALQLKITTTAAATLVVCSANGSSTTAYLRNGLPVSITVTDPNTLDATVTSDASKTFAQKCSLGNASMNIPGAGTWYLLFSSPAALTPGYDLFVVTPGSTGVTSRPVATTPLPCTYGGGPLAIAPVSASVAPKGSVPFAASGGSNAGFAFAFATNASGGTINATTGAYVAGPTGGVTDVVKVTDSAGASANAKVTVGPGITISPRDVTVQPHALQQFSASGGSSSGYVWSMQASPTGGTIDAHGGIYSAGANGGADVVLVTDSLGNTATAKATVPDTSGCSAVGSASLLWALGLVGLVLWRRKATGR